MRLLVDLCVGPGVEQSLTVMGHDVLSVRGINIRMPDTDILLTAVQEQRFIVTMDKDFGELVYNSGQPHHGILLLRLDHATAAEKCAIVRDLFRLHAGQLAGKFCVYQNGILRIRG